MAKKKKPAIKAGANRGFATTSVPSKKPVQAADAAADDTSQPGGQAGGGGGEDTAATAATSSSKSNGAPAAGTRQDQSQSRPGEAEEHDFEAESEEMELQLLVDKVHERAEREVTRLWKAIDYDRRLAKGFPTFSLDPELNERALALAASLSGLSNTSKSPNGTDTPAPSGSQTPTNPGGMDSAASEPPSLPSIQPQSNSNQTLTPLPPSLCDEEKLYIRALSTLGLLQRLGFTLEQAQQALRATSGPYDLEDCVSYLISVLDDAQLEAVDKRQKGLDSAAGPSTEGGDAGPSDSTADESVPPQHDAYSFERTVAARGAFHSQVKSASKKAAAAEAAGDAQAPAVVSDLEAAELTSKLRGISLSCSTLLSELEDEITQGSEGCGLMDTLESPSTAWARARLAQIKMDRLKGQQTKLVRSGASTTAAFDASKFTRLSTRLSDVMRDAERARNFDREMAADFLRQERLQWETEIRQEEADAAAEERGDGERSKDGDGDGDGDGDDKGPKEATGASEPATAEDTPAADAASDGEPDDMFGGMLDETPKEVTDESTGVAIRLRPLPATIKGGRTPRSLLSESLRRIDPAAHVRYEPVTTGGRLNRSRLTMRWPGPEGKKSTQSYVDVFQLTGEAAESQSAADDLLATLALSCVERDRPTYRTLPVPYREWYEELDRCRKAEKKSRAVELMRTMKSILQPRLEEIATRKHQKKASAAAGTTDSAVKAGEPGQTDLGALAYGAVRPLSEEMAETQRRKFETKVQAVSYQKMLPQRQSLPIYKYRDHILDVLDNNQVFVLSGETGCGKSTQVPAYILEHCLLQGKPCKIYCTEPRRISAISLAERVSQELGEPRGAVGGDQSLVGYAIRLDSHIGREAKLVYATSGILLRMLEGTSINEVTHIVIDEVHERSIESDFLLIILKTLLQHRKDLKIVLMSATLDAERISAYCGGCPTVSVPGRTFPVQVNYLEDAVELTKYTIEDDSAYAIKPRRDKYGRKADVPGNRAKLQSTEDDDAVDEDDDDEDDDVDRDGAVSTSLAANKGGAQRYSPKTISTMDRMDEYVINHDLIVSLIERICFSPDLQQFSAAILVFMPGLQDIRKLTDMLSSHRAFGSNAFVISPLHSTLSSEEQSAVFNIPPQGVRKIVISTNIAETGVTIPDVTCVIDSGKHREMRFDEKRQTSRLVDCFVAKSNAKQRRGRAGRVQEGLCFHLFTKERHDRYLADHPLPEMLRLSLQDLALKLKIMKIRIGNSVADALSQALDPPSPVNVQRAVSALIEVKALTTTEEITPLGRHLARIPLDVHMGKFLLIATLFKCLDSALTIAAALNSKSPFVTPFGREAEADLAKASFKVGNSDFLTIANAFNSWRRAVAQKHHFTFCRKSFLSHQTLQQMEELRQQYMAFLLDTGFAQVDEATKQSIVSMRYRSGGGGGGGVRLMETPAQLDSNGHSMAVLHAALAVGLYPKLLSVEPRSYQLRTIGNHQPASIHPSSVNFRWRLSELPRGTSHLVYFTIVQSRKLYARETAPVSDAALLLLCGDLEVKASCGAVYLDRAKARFGVSDGRNLVAIKAVREQLARWITASFRSPGKARSREQEEAFALALEMIGAFANDADRFGGKSDAS